jgi:geranylgeranyl pyrophosphate synthase
LSIIKDKTASLIASCCYNAAVLAGASAERIQALTDYGLNFGLGFQIIDDCLDFTGREKKLGKTLGLDLKRGSLTLPLIYFLKNRRFSLNRRSDLNKLRDLVLKSNALTQAYRKAQAYIQKAQSALKIFKNSAVKNSLVELSEFVLERGS